mgnify:CR=1 FL=1
MQHLMGNPERIGLNAKAISTWSSEIDFAGREPQTSCTLAAPLKPAVGFGCDFIPFNACHGLSGVHRNARTLRRRGIPADVFGRRSKANGRGAWAGYLAGGGHQAQEQGNSLHAVKDCAGTTGAQGEQTPKGELRC